MLQQAIIGCPGWLRFALAAVLPFGALTCGLLPATARADGMLPCEPEKVATRYPGLAGKTIQVGQDGTSLPYSYRDPNDPGHIIGADADFARAVFACIGLPVEFTIGTWKGLLPEVTSGRIDAIWNVLYYQQDRAELVDYVLYSIASDSALVRKGNPKQIYSFDDICGMRALGGIGTTEANMLFGLNEKCIFAGKDPIDVKTWSDKAGARRMIERDRADVLLLPSALATEVAADKPDVFEVGFTFLTDIEVGVGVGKGNTELEQAIRDAMEATQASGEVARIYAHYKLDPKRLLPPVILAK